MSELYSCPRARFVRPGGGDETVDWSECASVLLAHAATGQPPREETQVQCCWSPDRFYVRFLCRDTHAASKFENRDDPLYEQDVVELFLDEEGLGRKYLELEVSPRNVVFDAWVENDGVDRVTKLDKEWDLEGLRTSVRLTDSDCREYLISIPASHFAAPLVSGVRWRANFYRIDEDAAGVREFQAWRPTGKINFHIPSRFGTIELA
ncbi:carbohydrate-binding family 9-like protein [Cohnella zeiphila]|uniref:Carbohydrate-binding family 9-like protein n=1 Tax=Cohnella zeiphila TaxID=2761120 RepID=A0A7X0ST13_9BACL|nr:carbohydrate-binding family 9-like protein [Cohnella zeiphila]MBB6735586.1 carbohydrate-binding family 9-like protein [Cohnella zeiphila]